MAAGQSLSQRLGLYAGTVRGFSAAVRSFPAGDQPVVLNLRIRRPGGERVILREAQVRLLEGGPQIVSMGTLPPVDLAELRAVELEIELAAGSAGEVIILATRQENIPAGGVLINGAPSDPWVRADIAPLLATKSLSLVRTTLAASAARSLLYFAGTLALATLAASLALGAVARLRGSRLRGGMRTAFLLSAVPLTAFGMVVATATFGVRTGRPYLEGVRDGYWGAAIAFTWMSAAVMAVPWGVLWWRQGWRTARTPWRQAFTPAVVWRPCVASALWSLLLAMPFALWRQDAPAQTFGAVSLVALGIGVGLGMIAGLRRSP